MEQDYRTAEPSFVATVKVWKRYRLVFLIVGVAALVGSTVASLLIAPKFRATAVFAPTRELQVPGTPLSDSLFVEFNNFGGAVEREQFLEVMASGAFRDTLISRMGLHSYWGLQTTGDKSMQAARNLYGKHVRVKPTQFIGIAVEVTDADPQMAAAVANAAVGIADSMMHSLKSEVAAKTLQPLEHQYRLALMELASLQDSFANLKKSFGLAPAVELSGLRQAIAFARVQVTGDIPTCYVIDRAVKPSVKVSPNRGLIVVISTLSAIFFTIFVVAVLELARGSKLNQGD